jgi:acetyl esterase/lipase
MLNKRLSTIFTLISILFLGNIIGQNYIDTVYTIQSDFDLSFDTAVDFAGNTRVLNMDISYPTNDSPSECGRPLLVVIHGGAWIAGDKSEINVSRIKTDFAKRGYTAASVNYRLGQFQTSSAINCNTQPFGLEWNCFNMGDTSEWYRAYYRGIQDVNSAIRYLVNNDSIYDIDAQQIFIVGESAGGFIAMGVGYIDNASEVQQSQIMSLSAIAAPNTIYESSCIQGYGLDTAIASMDFSRPSLGGYVDGGNYPLQGSYTIKGVGNIFGGVFNNIFSTTTGVPPALYLFHQPNDLIVPFNSQKVFAGYNACMINFPFNCGTIVNRPFISGSNGVKQMIDDLASQGQTVPLYMTDFTNNTSPCSTTPSHGHAYDNFWLRTNNMATFFAPMVTPCELGQNNKENPFPFILYPNPVNGNRISIKGDYLGSEVIRITDLNGKLLNISVENGIGECILSVDNLAPGHYIVSIQQNGYTYRSRFIKVY